MDIKEYIQSGIIEQYVLGLATPHEAAELEQLRAEYPELKQAILNFEESLEAEIFANEIQAPAFIKSAIEKQLFTDSSSKAVVVEGLSAPQLEKRLVPLLWRYIAAACIILLIVSTALNFYFYSSFKNTQEQYQALLTERNTLHANNVLYQQSLQVFQDTAMRRIEMRALPGKGQNFATVLWNPNTKNVYLSANKMQQTPTGKQYQLWAIVNGKPVSAGVINNCIGLCKMENIDGAQAFAITLEKEGGSPTPTLTEMYVLGNI